VQASVSVPDELWQAVRALATQEGDTNTVILRALEEYVATMAKRSVRRRGKYRKLVKALSMPVSDLHLSARPASTLKMLNIRYVCELVQKAPVDLFKLPNFGEKSLREVKEKLAHLGLTLGMTLEGDSYGAAVVATVAASIRAAEE
jgi:DNA-directed RNA polymerase alpha subunit